MATEIKLPELGENLEGGDVLDVKVTAGATVTKGQSLLEVEAEKSTVEVPAPMGGRITELRVKRGDHIRVGQTVCLIEEAEAKAGAKKTPAKAEPETKEQPETGRKAKAAKEPAAEEQPESKSKAKAAEEPDRPKKAAEAAKEKPSGNGRREQPGAKAADGELVPAGPATRRLARELGIDLRQVPASAPTGRVTEDDIKAYVKELASEGAGLRQRPVAGAAVPPLPDFAKWGQVERQPFDGVRRRTADQVSLAWAVAPQVTQYDQSDITDLEAFRRQQEGRGPKLTITVFALKAAAIALKEFPTFNASLDAAASELVLKRYYHIGVAVDTDRGLLVPVLRDVDQKSVIQLAKELTDIAERARQKKLAAEEMRGGSFTVSNLGGIGGTAFSPIVNYPEVAILGLARSRLQPVVREGEMASRLLLPLCLTYDHRVIDGAAAARFTRRLAELLENPLQMLLHA